MAKKRTGRRKSKREIDWAAVRRWGLRTAAVLLLAALAVGLTVGVDRLRTLASATLAGRERGGVLEVSFEWPEIPSSGGKTWLPDRDQAELIRAAERAGGKDDPLSVDPLREISAELAATGWFASEPRVRRVSPGRVLVSPEWRQPAAEVRWQGRDYLISTRGEPMPPVYRPGGGNRPVILGCREGPGRGAGRLGPWPGRDVHAGLLLLKTLWRNGLIEPIAGVDVSAYNDGGPLEIVTAHSTRIVWGSAPDEWKPGEPSVEERIARLKGLIETTGRIDGGQKRIEINHDRVEIDRTGDD